MIRRNIALKMVALALGFAGLSAPALAERTSDFQFAEELDACVSALAGELDLSGVYRIRHIVTKSNARGLGYSLTIKTQTFSAVADRQYSAVCVTTGNNQPSKLKIAETIS